MAEQEHDDDRPGDDRPADERPADDRPAGDDTGADAGAEDGGREDAVLLYVGGPLDGRVEVRPARHGDPLPVVTHTHLHDGPKVVHRYDLQALPGSTGVYRVRDGARRSADAGRRASEGGDAGPEQR